MTVDEWEWDEIDVAGEFPPLQKWETPGDAVVGVVAAKRKTTFKGADEPTYVLDVETADGKRVTVKVDLVDLRAKLKPLAPQLGDKLAIKFVGTEKTPNGTRKQFAVRHQQGERPTPAPEPPAVVFDDGEEPF